MDLFLQICIAIVIAVVLCFTILIGISAFSTGSSTPDKWNVTRCYVDVGGKQVVLAEAEYRMTINGGVMFAFRKSDNKLIYTTSQFTGVCDDAADPNVKVTIEKVDAASKE